MANFRLQLRPYADDDCGEVARLFQRAVHAIDHPLYPPRLLQAWAPSPIDYSAWHQRLQRRHPLLACIDARLVGFMELEANGHIDACYIDPQFQRQGIASALYNALETQARSQGLQRLWVEASALARPFFHSQGFTLLGTNRVVRRGEELVNYRMEKVLMKRDGS